MDNPGDFSPSTSLQNLSNNPVERKQQIWHYRNLATQHMHTHPQRALEITENLLETITTSQAPVATFQNELADILMLQGEISLITGDHYRALEAYTRSLKLVKENENPTQAGIRLAKIGFIQTVLKKYSEALEMLFRALSIAQKTNNKIMEGQALNYIGSIYIDLSEAAKGLSYLQQSHDMVASAGNPEELGKIYISLCRAYLTQDNLEKAYFYGNQAVAQFRETQKHYYLAESLIYLGRVHLAMKAYPQAQETVAGALKLAERFNYPREASMALCLLGRMQIEVKDDPNAENNLHESLRLAENINLRPTITECHYLLAELYASQGNYDQAYEHHKKYHTTTEQSHQLDILNRVKLLELSHNLETARKISEALQEQNQALRDEVRLRENAQSKLEELSRKDSLTGIYNRRYFFELAEQEFNRARRYKRPVAMIMIDLDHFKNINDTHGHLVGDQVLTEIANRIQKNSREVDIVGRYGGEEFIILLPETTLDDACILAQRIWNSLTQRPTATSKLVLPIQASIGVAGSSIEDEISLYKLIDQADQALYRAKDLGRNRIEVFKEQP